MNDFSQNASAFNCGLITFKKLDMDQMPPVRFPWQYHDHSGRQLFVNKQNAFD